MRFSHYVNDNILPVTQIEIRESRHHDAVLALASHAPSCGISYGPVDDLIISIVLVSNHSPVVRDIGTGRRRFIEGPGCILVTPPHTPSYWYFESTPLVLHVTVPGARAECFLDMHLNGRIDAFNRLAEKPIYDSLATQLGSRIWLASADISSFSSTFNTHALSTLLSILCCQRLAPRIASPARCGALSPWRLKKVTALMVNRLHKPMSVEALAASVQLSADHFLRSFAAATGHTPHQWLTQMRMEKAKRLLRETRLPATEIALDLGYSSSGHFSSRFRQVVGMSPSIWRRTFANDPQQAD